MKTSNMKKVRRQRRMSFSNLYVYASLTFIFAIIAFWPVYFSKLKEVRLSIHLHSILAMLWVVVIITQSWLARKGQFKKHKRLGKLTYIFTPLLVLTTLELFHSFLNADSPFTEAFGAQIMFYDLTGLIYFCMAFILGVTIYKKNIQLHARLMVTTIMMMLFPVIGRLLLFYLDFGLSAGDLLELSVYIIDVIVLLIVVFDRKNLRSYPVFPILFMVTLLQHLGYVYCNDWTFWEGFLNWYAAI